MAELSGKPLNELAQTIHEWGKRKGWMDKERAFSELIALCHSELSEALEEWRRERPSLWINGDKKNKPEGWGIELADVLIRVLHMVAIYDLDIDELLRMKMVYNETRPYRHGGLRA